MKVRAVACLLACVLFLPSTSVGGEETQRVQLYRTSQEVIRLQRHLTTVRRRLSNMRAIAPSRRGQVMSLLEEAERALMEAQAELTRGHDPDRDVTTNEEERVR